MLSLQNLIELAKKKAPLLLGLLALTIGVVLYFVKYRREAFNVNFKINKQQNEKRVNFKEPPVQEEIEMKEMSPQEGHKNHVEIEEMEQMEQAEMV